MMSFWATILNGIASTTTSENAFRRRLTPANALDELRSFNEIGSIRRAAEAIEDPVYSFEWLLNSFQYAAGVVSQELVVDMGRYLNRSDVFQHVAPHFYGNTTWTCVLSILLTRCAPEKRPRLLSIFEEVGHMQGIVREQFVSPFFFFESFMGALSEEDAIRILKRSPSFSIAKMNSIFALKVVEAYPQYKVLLD